MKPGRSSCDEGFGRPQDGAASPAAPPVGGARICEQLVAHFVGWSPDRRHRLPPQPEFTGNAPGPGSSIGHGAPMGRSGTGACSPSMIFLLSTGDVSAPYVDADANCRIRFFSPAPFQCSCVFSVILVEPSLAKQFWSFRIHLSTFHPSREKNISANFHS